MAKKILTIRKNGFANFLIGLARVRGRFIYIPFFVGYREGSKYTRQTWTVG